MRVWGGTADISLGWMFEMWGKRKPIVSGLEIRELLGQTGQKRYYTSSVAWASEDLMASTLALWNAAQRLLNYPTGG